MGLVLGDCDGCPWADGEIQGISHVDEKGRLSRPHVVCGFFSGDPGTGRGSSDG